MGGVKTREPVTGRWSGVFDGLELSLGAGHELPLQRATSSNAVLH